MNERIRTERERKRGRKVCKTTFVARSLNTAGVLSRRIKGTSLYEWHDISVFPWLCNNIMCEATTIYISSELLVAATPNVDVGPIHPLKLTMNLRENIDKMTTGYKANYKNSSWLALVLTRLVTDQWKIDVVVALWRCRHSCDRIIDSKSIAIIILLFSLFLSKIQTFVFLRRTKVCRIVWALPVEYWWQQKI